MPTDRRAANVADSRSAHGRYHWLALCVMLALLTLGAGTAAPQDITPAEAEVIARDGYIYGFPVVENYRRMYFQAIDPDSEQYKAPLNTLKHDSELATPADTSVVTPDVDTLSSVVWMDLRAEPLIISVPAMEDDRYYAIQLVDLYNYNFAYIGSRTTGSGEGQYLIAGPGWAGETPETVDQEIRSETQFALAIFRTQVRGPKDLGRVKAVQNQYKVQPLSVFLGQPQPDSAPTVNFPKPGATTAPDLSFFSTLSFLLPFCATHASERQVRAGLARIGVAADSTFDAAALSPEIRESLRRGIIAGSAAIASAAESLTVTEITGSREFLRDDFIKRAAGALPGSYSNSREEAIETLYLTDARGEPLDASETNYLLRFSEAELPPVSGFWSVTIYDGETRGLVANAENRHQINSSMLPGLRKDAEEGLTVLIQNESPTEEQAANWLPAPEGPFYIVLRLYWPMPKAYDGTWTPPLVWSAEPATRAPVPRPAGAETAAVVEPAILPNQSKPEMERPRVWEEPTEVRVAIYVIDIDEVDSAGQDFSASIYFEARWKNPFLRHKGPGPIHRQLTEVWNPRLAIISQKMAWRSYPESVEIHSDGAVIYRQKIWGRFSQPLNLRDFPFDRQQLAFHLVAAGLKEKDVKLVPLESASGRTSDIAAKFSMPDFAVASWDASPASYRTGENDVTAAGYQMTIDVNRKPTYYVLKIIVPLCLIIIMSWLPRWMDPEQSGTNIGVSTSAFLTLVAYLFAVTVLLPRVSYVTRMDRFILLSTLMVFAGLLQTVCNAVLVRDAKKPLADRIDRRSRIVYPILLAVVLVVSFIL